MQANGKYCVIVWSKAQKKTVFKINFSNRVKSVFLTDKDLIVVHRNQINVYDLITFSLLIKKEGLGAIVQAKLITQPNRYVLGYIEEKVCGLTSRNQVHRDQPLQKFRRIFGQDPRQRDSNVRRVTR
jgi:hypothetical protein